MRTRITIFTPAEQLALARRMRGDVSDPTGIFRRAKDKLEEIQAWQTPTGKKLLHKLLQQQRNTPEEETAQPNEEKSFEEFAQEIGY